MSRTRQVTMAAALLALLGLGSWGVAQGTSWWHDRQDPVIATVDGAAIRLSQAEARMSGLTSVHGGMETGTDWHAMVLQSLVDDVLITREAARSGIEVSPTDLGDAMAHLQAGFSSRDEYRSWLEKQGMDEAELARRMRLQLLAARVYEAITAEVMATDAELEAYYEDHSADYTAGGETKSFDEVRDDVVQKVEKAQKDTVFSIWLDGARKSVEVVASDDWK